MTKLFAFVLAFFALCALIAGLAVLFTIPVWLAWNWVAVDVGHFQHISIWQAWGISFLCGCLFKSSSVNSK